jgi:CDP-paratose 2-epimerase
MAQAWLQQGHTVTVYDNLSRPGSERNLEWLRASTGAALQIIHGDIRAAAAITAAVRDVDVVAHLAGQVAVTTSVKNPREDFEINALGTFNVLEAARNAPSPPIVMYASTNKVYGGMEDVPLKLRGLRYEPCDAGLRTRGFGEDRRLDFHSPYGCSKGAADQYVLDYARSYGLRTAVFRMSCIYGPHQFGTEDQGWVAHFLIRALEDRAITLYGDGMQVRDVLYVDDLVRAFLLAERHIDTLAGQAFNMGGGAANTLSLLELVDLIGELHGAAPRIFYESWRTGDQRYYVSDTARFAAATGWRPRVNVREGVGNLYNWLLESRGLAEAPVAVGRHAS